MIAPDTKSAPIEEVLAWWDAEGKDLGSRLWWAKRRITEYLRDNGPTDHDGNRFALAPDGFDWDANAVADVMPALIGEAVLTVKGTGPDVSRAEDLLVEEFQGRLTLTSQLTVDKKEAARVIRAGGDAAERLRLCRTQRTRIEVVAR